ncbi:MULTISPECIES: DUF2946 family protein [unclassified Bradyrhizobium]|uniref:DUF2946 family protein n=1 Tax=Bradyrhizobium sp. LLZ17 TaxID=3239388 RepID=A0AB39XDL6_9BRAD
MGRRLEVFIPIMLLSILVQSFAPIAAFRAVADAVNDPLYMGSICSEAMSSPTDPRTAPTQQSQGCCVFCAAGHSVAAIAGDPPPFIFAVLQRQYQRVSWLEAAPSPSTARVGSNAEARAPPHLT